MSDEISLDGRTLAGVANAEAGEVSGETRFHFEQEGNRIYAQYAGGDVVDGHLVGTLDGHRWDVRSVQLNSAGEPVTGHSIGVGRRLDDGRVRAEDEWVWESRDGRGESVLDEVERHRRCVGTPRTVGTPTGRSSHTVAGRSFLKYVTGCREDARRPDHGAVVDTW